MPGEPNIDQRILLPHSPETPSQVENVKPEDVSPEETLPDQKREIPRAEPHLEEKIDAIQTYIQEMGEPVIRPLPDIIDNPASPEELWKWHHKNQQTETEVPVLSPVSITETYQTWEEKGAHEKYKALGLDFIYQRTSFEGALKIAQAGTNLSAVDSLKNGQAGVGRSVDLDFESGGANSVFLSTAVTGKGKTYNKDPFLYTQTNASEVFIEYASDVLDRADWYAYNNDNFGSTRDEALAERPSPQEFFQSQNTVNNQQNEICFPHAIGNEKIKSIVVPTNDSRQYLLERLSALGVRQVNGKSIKEIVITKKKFDFDRSTVGKVINRVRSFFKTSP